MTNLTNRMMPTENLEHRQHTKSPRRMLIACVLLLSILFALGAIILWWCTQPLSQDVIIKAGGEAHSHPGFPVALTNALPGTYQVMFSFNLGNWHPEAYLFYANDELYGLTINGRSVNSPEFPIIGFHQGQTLDLAEYLQPGKNHFQAQLNNWFGIASLQVYRSPTDWLSLLVISLGASSLLLLLGWFHLTWPSLFNWPLTLLLSAAGLLRLYYWWLNPYFIRAYDEGGHLSYILYVAYHWELPPINAGWETFQPPLYYTITGALAALPHALGVPREGVFAILSFSSICLSFIFLLLAVWVATLLFSNAKDERRYWLVAIVAVLPAIVYYTTRISNDVLFAVVSLAWLGCLLLFWKQGNWTAWIGAMVLSALSLWVKTNGIIFLPISVLTLFSLPSANWKAKLDRLYVAVLLFGFIAGPLLMAKILQATDSSNFVVGNIHLLEDSLRFQPTIWNHITFNPWEILQHPYNNPRMETPRSDLFWEFYYRSAFFGEWAIAPSLLFLGRCILALSLVMLPFLAYGVWTSNRNTPRLGIPLFISVVLVLGAQLAWVIRHPVTPSQDFRFFIFLAIPYAYFILATLPNCHFYVRYALRICLGLFVFSCGLYILLLPT